MIKNDLFLRAARGEKTSRPPVWLMRQAGRILPEYRAVRAKLSGFRELVTTPELACEVTLQPVDILGVDAAIIFSDILVIPEAMGLPYEMIKGKGPLFPKTVQTLADVAALQSGEAAAAELEYVYEALRLTKKELAQRVPLIGFAGAPWTIFAYMIEGSGSKTFSKPKRMLYQEPELSMQLLDKITDTTIAYLRKKVEAGADLIQIFDSWAAVLTPAHYKKFALPYIQRIVASLSDVPVTVFAKGAWQVLPEIQATGASVIGLDWTTPPALAREKLGKQQVLQGNLDPCQLYAPVHDIQRATKAMIQDFGGNHIVNLGHGVYPDTPLDGVRAFIDAVQSA